jgi:hypothetical protein
MLVISGGFGCASSTPTPANVPPETASVKETAAVPPTPNGRNFQSQLDTAIINRDEILTVLPPDTILAVLPDRVPQLMVTAAEAEALDINPSVRILGVSLAGDHRAYPIPFMSNHEIVNDVIGGRPLAVTW